MFILIFALQRSHNLNICLIGYFNGDGLWDVLTRNSIFFSTGTGFYKHDLTTPISNNFVFPIKFNGDNRTDIAFLSSDANNLSFG